MDIGDVAISMAPEHIATVEIRRPPNNFFDVDLVSRLADVYEELDDLAACRAIVLCSEGKHFCAGAALDPDEPSDPAAYGRPNPLYVAAARLFSTRKPVIAAVQGAAIGGGLGLACSADFRIGSTTCRFAASFSRLGFHHGFGLTVTLPRIVGFQHATQMLYAGQTVSAPEAAESGLIDQIVDEQDVRKAAMRFALQIAEAAPLAVLSIRETMRGDLARQVERAMVRENTEQLRLRQTQDWIEGVQASAMKRRPVFTGS